MRALWGIYDNSNRMIKRRYQMDKDMSKIKANQFNEPFVVYVYGKENYEMAKAKGFDCILVDENPAPFDLVKEQYRHKLELINYAMQNDGYDEMVFLDWDCVPQKKLPEDFWQVLGKKEIIQCNLQQYHRRKCLWRGKKDTRKLPNAGFVYLRGKQVAEDILKAWDTRRCKGPSAEPAIALVMDEMSDGWQGMEKYWDLYEPDFCNLWKCSVYPKDRLDTKNVSFIHYQG